MESHSEHVSNISSQIANYHSTKTPFRIYHGSTNSTRHFPASQATISTAHLTNIQIDPTKNVAIAEPNVPMDSLLDASLAHGLVPLVVMEFPGITVGGGFSGTSGESSSFGYGFFDRTVNWIEIVTGEGEVRVVHRDAGGEEGELFWGAASSFGTLGVVTLLEVQLRPVKGFIELQYFPRGSMKEAIGLFEELTRDENTEYLDGVVYGKDEIVVCAGRLVDSPSSKNPITRLTRARDDWFYLHARKRASQSISPSIATDYIPVTDYLFRYDRGGFWVGRYAYQYFMVPFIWLTRYILDWFMHTRVMYHALHQSGHSRRYIIQDVAVPYNGTSEFLEWLDKRENFGHYPIWLCPLKYKADGEGKGGGGLMIDDNNANQSSRAEGIEGRGNGYLMNFGIWAPSPHTRSPEAFVTQNRNLERKVSSLGGKKWLYAHAYYTQDEFWSIYDKPKYDGLRAKYHADYLPDLYEKVRVDLRGKYDGRTGVVNWVKSVLWEIWPVSGLVGVWRAWWGGEYLLKKNR